MLDELELQAPEEAVLRQRLGNLRALLVISLLMTESVDEEQILQLASSSAPGLGRWWIEGYAFVDGGWHCGTKAGPKAGTKARTNAGTTAGAPADGGGAIAAMPAGLSERLAALAGNPGPVQLVGPSWAGAFPLRSVTGLLGYLIAGSDEEPTVDEYFLIQVVAQQTGVAVSNARLHARERTTAAELVATNTALEETVSTLQRSIRIHDRLTKVAVSGEGQPGIARALHELTGMSIAIEDRHGNLRAWAGPGLPEPYPKESFARREQLLRWLVREGKPVRDGARMTMLASPRPDVLGVLSLIDPERRADGADLIALEHGATVLSVELARVRGIADTELRLRRDLVHDLLTGTDDESAYLRADALEHDLRQPHRVIVVEGRGRTRSEDLLLHAVRRTLRDHRLSFLLDTWSGAVVLLTAGETDWEQLRIAILTELGGGQCRLGVGSPSVIPSELPRSLREAQLALRLQRTVLSGTAACEYSKLGVFRMLAAIPNLAEVDTFVREWLGVLIDYDATKHAELVKTLTQYLEHGGNYDATASKLSVHRSTLKYRLQRIRELTGLELNDPDVHFNLQLATRAWTTAQALRS